MTRALAGVVAGASLLSCLAAPILHFRGTLEEEAYRLMFGLASVGWFAGATVWTVLTKKNANRQ